MYGHHLQSDHYLINQSIPLRERLQRGWEGSNTAMMDTERWRMPTFPRTALAARSVLPSNRPATPLFSPACWEPGFQAWAQSPCPELSTQGLVPLRQHLELVQTHAHQIGDTLQPSHPLLLLPPVPPSISSVVKNPSANAGDAALIPGSGRSPGEGNGNPLQYFCLENPRDGGAWWAAICGVAHGRR